MKPVKKYMDRNFENTVFQLLIPHIFIVNTIYASDSNIEICFFCAYIKNEQMAFSHKFFSRPGL